MSKIYSPQIIEYTQKVIELLSIHDETVGGNFFETQTPEDPELGKEVLYEKIADVATENFLVKETILLTEEQFDDVFITTKLEVILRSLQKKGLLNSVDNEHGEEVFFLTERGKQLAKRYDK